jgi:hypothetical protein
LELWIRTPAAAKPEENSEVKENMTRVAAFAGRKNPGRWIAAKCSTVLKKPEVLARVIR